MIHGYLISLGLPKEILFVDVYEFMYQHSTKNLVKTVLLIDTLHRVSLNPISFRNGNVYRPKRNNIGLNLELSLTNLQQMESSGNMTYQNVKFSHQVQYIKQQWLSITSFLPP